MSKLNDVIELLRSEVTNPSAAVGIVSDRGANDESCIMGTKDGILNLAICLVGFLREVEEGRAEVNDDGAASSQDVQRVVYQIPSARECWPVGVAMYETHEKLLKAMNRSLEGVLPEEYLLQNDPHFQAPE